MPTRKEATAFIRFQLEQLRSKNAFHEFEHICRQYARVRIDRSVVPATGPVSAGGDQGRDFESLLWFDGTGQDGRRNVFACTTQQDGLWEKLQTDLHAISTGSAIRAVYFFTAVDVTVGTRHKWQEWASTNLQLQVDVIDGQALSEHLADADLVWIAEEYLGVGKEHLPAAATQGRSYGELVTTWAQPGKVVTSLEDYFSVRYGVRTTTRPHSEHTNDAEVWLGCMRRYIDSIPASHPLWFSAVYEYIVGFFFVHRHISGLDSLVDQYLERIPRDGKEGDPADLLDFLTVLNCTIGADLTGKTPLTPEKIRAWRALISSACEMALERETRPSRRCGLLNVSALLCLSDSTMDEADRHSGALRAWREIVDIVDDARFFNVYALAQALSDVAVMFKGQKEFHDITVALGTKVATRIGGAVAAELCCDRAQRYYEAGQVGNAVRELHRAKAEWFAGESLHECLQTFEQIARLYMELGLHLAALYYVQAGLVLACESKNVNFTAQVCSFVYLLTDCRYALGQSYEYVQSAELALSLIGDSSTIEHTLARYLGTVAFIERVEPRLGKAIKLGWKSHPLGASFRANDPNAATMAAEVMEGGEAIPCGLFTDAGRERSVHWTAYDAEWRIRCTNRREDVAAAEALGAMLQIMLADMFDKDPWCLPGPITIDVAVEGNGHEVDVESCRDGARVVLGRSWWNGDSTAMSLAFSKLVAAVFLKLDLQALLQPALEDGLVGKLFVGAPYPLLRESALLARPTRWVRSRRLWGARVDPQFESHEELTLGSRRVAGHSGDEWDLAVGARYERWIAKLGPALRSLRDVPGVMDAVRTWRQQGVPEWHIVGALGSILVTRLFVKTHGVVPSKNRQDLVAFFESLASADIDTENLSIDAEEFEGAMVAYLPAFLASEGVHVDVERWDAEKYETFARSRLGFGDLGPAAPDWLGEKQH